MISVIIPLRCKEETIDGAPATISLGRVGNSFKNPENIGSGSRTSLEFRTPLVDKIENCPLVAHEKNPASMALETSEEGVDG